MRHSIFAIELAMRMTAESPLREALARCVRDASPSMSYHGKWQQYTYAASLLHDNLELAERGCWDYWNDDARALRDYEDWSGSMLTRDGVRQAPSGGADPYRGEPRYLTFTIAMLLVQDSPSDMSLRQTCDVLETDYWKRGTFARILRGIGHVSFASVKSDSIYLIPRDEGWGLTAQDLRHPKFGYLREIV